jgi:hypothetical protein
MVKKPIRVDYFISYWTTAVLNGRTREELANDLAVSPATLQRRMRGLKHNYGVNLPPLPLRRRQCYSDRVKTAYKEALVSIEYVQKKRAEQAARLNYPATLN